MRMKEMQGMIIRVMWVVGSDEQRQRKRAVRLMEGMLEIHLAYPPVMLNVSCWGDKVDRKG